MKDHFTKEKIQYNAPVWACILFILFLFFLPTGYQEIYREADQCVAKVLETDDSAIIDTGLVRENSDASWKSSAVSLKGNRPKASIC